MSAKDYMRAALAQAEIAMTLGEVPVGAVVVRNNTVIASACNLREQNRQACSHAEMLAIESACKCLNSWRLDGCDIYVTLEPCPMCAGAIIQARIKSVYFGCYDKKSGAFGGVADISTFGWTNKPNVYGGILEEECSVPLEKFFAEIRSRGKL